MRTNVRFEKRKVKGVRRRCLRIFLGFSDGDNGMDSEASPESRLIGVFSRLLGGG